MSNVLSHVGEESEDGQTSCKMLCKHFSSTFAPPDFPVLDDNFCSPIILNSVLPSDFENQLKSLDSTKGSGADRLHLIFVKNFAIFIIYLIPYICRSMMGLL